MKVIPAAMAAFLALDVENIELADEVAKNDGTFTRHVTTTFPSAGALCR
jgi:hypothetical protein